MQPDNAAEVDCGDCPASSRCWQGHASPGEGFLVRRMRLVQPGEIVLRQYAPFEAPLVVTSGCLSITELRTDGRERVVAFRVPGEMVGLESWSSGQHRFGAQALVQTTVCRLRWSRSIGAARSQALWRALLAKSTEANIQASHPWAGLAATERVRAFVTDFRSRTDQPLPMTRAQIGSHLGLAEETVVRALKALERD